MLPEDWKKQIQQALNEAAKRSFLDRFANDFVGYKDNFREAERGKARRERVTIGGVFLTAGVALGTALILAGQWYEFRRGNVAVQRAFLTSYEVKIDKVGNNDDPTWEVSPYIENAGNTSAVRIRSRLIRVYYSPIWRMRRIHVTGGQDPDTSEMDFDGLPAANMSSCPP